MQALASYVFIAANVILHASEAFQSKHLDELLPPIVPLLTSHHHSLRGFTQVINFYNFLLEKKKWRTCFFTYILLCKLFFFLSRFIIVG